MGDKSDNSSENTHQEGQVNQDELIMQQQRQIEKEVKMFILLRFVVMFYNFYLIKIFITLKFNFSCIYLQQMK